MRASVFRSFLVIAGLLIVGLPAFISCTYHDDSAEPEPAAGRMTPSCSAKVVFTDQADRFNVNGDLCGASWNEVTASLAIIEMQKRRWYDLGTWPERSIQKVDRQTVWTVSGHPDLPDVQVTFAPAKGVITLEVAVAAVNDSVTVAGFQLNGLIDFPGSPERLIWLHEGYDSWSFAGTVELTPDLKPLPQAAGTDAPLGNNYDYLSDRESISWWTCAVRGPSYNDGLVIGALTADLFKTYFTAAADQESWRLKVVSGTSGDTKLVEQGTVLRLDNLRLELTDDPVRGLVDYANASAQIRPLLKWEGFEPKGWATWYDYFAKVTEQDVLANLAVMVEKYAEKGFGVLQLDDGYMEFWGDWQKTKEEFPSGLAVLASTIEAEGIVPGIWIAPLLVDKKSSIALEHPDWILRVNGGEPVKAGDAFVKKKLILDITHPDVRDWLAGQISDLVEMGYRYLKLDFLFVGAVEATRILPDVTSMEAYRMACEVIGKAAGSDVYLLASGQPTLPSAGRFHAARTSSDICGSPIDKPTWRMVRNISRYNAARFYQEGAFYANDPDQLLIRDPLPDGLVEMTIAANILLGSNLWLGDSLVQLTRERENILLSDFYQNLEQLAGPTLPLDLFDRPVKRFIPFPYADLVLDANRTPMILLRERTLFLMNWTQEEQLLVVSVKQLGQEPGTSVTASGIDGLSPGSVVRSANGLLSFDVPALSMQAFRLTWD